MEVVRYADAILLGYLLGAIPIGLIVGKLIKGIDVREYGSGKTGATNALRTLGNLPAGLVVLGDVLKGLGAILVAHVLVDTAAATSLAGLAATVGHIWPIYAGFRGGRGVLVSFGIFWLICWPAALISSGVGFTVIAISRMVSLGVLSGAAIGVVATVPFVARFNYSPWVFIYALLSASLMVGRHLDNIERLRAGTERKLGQPAQPVA
ncbi:MAG TPA: glycerol-3-phosphate 1-O-acyltransferase PlsY [Chloroflexota bacterium]|nr:glycerol-3-phosphate 1-O-acyltransferase PlsY [Chloroflexota bacterium]